jgi:hypothetical protein
VSGKLPDHRDRESAFVDQRRRFFDDPAVAEVLGADSPRPFDTAVIEAKLERAVLNYYHEVTRDNAQPPAAEQRALFDDVKKRAAALRSSLANLSTYEQAQLGDVPDLVERLTEFEHMADEAVARLAGKESRRGKKSPAAYHEFIREFHGIYRKATGQSDRYPHTDTKGKYTGPFFEALKAILPFIGVKKTDAALDEDLKQAFKKAVRRQVKLPPKST